VCIVEENASVSFHITCLCGVLVQDSVLTKEEKVVELKEELADIQKEENKLKAEKLEVDQKIDTINKDIHENKVKIPALRKQVRSCLICLFHLTDV
jgi:peptidoglycan hydrolase CwlO-like protein